MATLQLLKPAIINGTPYTTAQLILTPVSPDRPKHILPKQEPTSPAKSTDFQIQKKPEPKKRIHFSKKALTHPRPQSVTRRNARERNRVKQVNQGFVTLANHVPEHLRSKKMSKVDTLRAAIAYIKDLRQALKESEEGLDDLPVTAASSPADLQVSSPLSTGTSTDNYHPRTPLSYTNEYNSQMELTFSPQFYEPVHNHNIPAMQYNSQYHPPQPQNTNNTFNYQRSIIDFTHPICSPSSTHSSDSGFDASHGNITPEEDEILEFASWFQ